MLTDCLDRLISANKQDEKTIVEDNFRSIEHQTDSQTPPADMDTLKREHSIQPLHDQTLALSDRSVSASEFSIHSGPRGMILTPERRTFAAISDLPAYVSSPDLDFNPLFSLQVPGSDRTACIRPFRGNRLLVQTL